MVFNIYHKTMSTTTEKNIYQLRNGFYVEEKTTELGGYVVYSDYEDTTDSNKQNPAIMDHFVGSPQHKIPNRLWNQMVTFFMRYLADNTEVECRYYKKGSDFICVVGNQSVTGASVKYNYDLPLYGLDGFMYTRESLVADGWVLYGHFHLHPFDMPSPSGVDDHGADGKGGELKLPLLYGIISIPTGRASDHHYRIRTTVVAHDGYQNRRYFPQSWDFIDLPVASEVQEYTAIAYAPVCESQVKRFAYQAPLQQTKWTKNSKWLQPATTTTTYQPKSLAERLQTALETILMYSAGTTVADIEKELPTVLAALAADDAQASALFTYDRYDSVDVADPYFYSGC